MPPGGRSRDREPAFEGLVILLALLAHAWILALPFQLDDYELLRRIGERGVPQPWPAPGDLSSSLVIKMWGQGGSTPDPYLFRPAAWALHWSLLAVGGGRAVPELFHSVMLLLHAFNAWLLYRVIRKLTQPRSALLGAVVFAIGAGGIQAVSWAAAGGDALAVCFALLTASALQGARADQPGSAARAGVFAALAFCSKESSLLLAPLILLLAWLAPARNGSRHVLLALGAAAGGVLAAALARWAYLGPSAAGAVAGAIGASSLEASSPRVLAALVFPWNHSPEVADQAPVFIRALEAKDLADLPGIALRATVAAVALPCVLALIARRGRGVLRLLIALACVLPPSLPAVLGTPDSLTNVSSRFLYPVMLAAAVLLAVGAAATGPARLAIGVALVPLFALAIDGTVHVARTELRAAGLVRARIESLENASASAPPGAHIFAVDPAELIAGIPLLHAGLPASMAPPFRESALRVSWAPSLDLLERLPWLTRESSPVVVLTAGDDGRFAEFGSSRGIPVGPLPLPQAADAAAIARWETAIPARALGGIRIRIGLESGSRSAAIRWLRNDAPPIETMAGLSGVGELHDLTVPAPEGLEWWLGPDVAGVEASNVTSFEVVEVLRELPRVALVEPDWDGSWSLVDAPSFVFRSDVAAEAWRITVVVRPLAHQRLPLHYRVAAARVDAAEDGTLRFTPRMNQPTEGPGITWEDVRKYAARRPASMVGSRIAVEWRVEGIDAETGLARSRSEWRVAFLDPTPQATASAAPAARPRDGER
jgi:hypothetical protein